MANPILPTQQNSALSQVLNGGGPTGGTDTSQLLNIANNANQLVQVIGRMTDILRAGLAKHKTPGP
jgi:hypothetical protein